MICFGKNKKNNKYYSASSLYRTIKAKEESKPECFVIKFLFSVPDFLHEIFPFLGGGWLLDNLYSSYLYKREL
jgi:hypothetical protein